MSKCIDPEKFASAFVSNPNAPKAEDKDLAVEHYFDLYLKAFKHADQYNQSIIEERKKKNSEQASKHMEALKKIRF